MKTTHRLEFEIAEWPYSSDILLFRVGSCTGQWFSSDFAYHILSILNEKPGNGHLQDVFEWFEASCLRDGKALMIMDFFNPEFKRHCIEKRGFKEVPGTDNLVKII
jgi:hypothetical protein